MPRSILWAALCLAPLAARADILDPLCTHVNLGVIHDAQAGRGDPQTYYCMGYLHQFGEAGLPKDLRLAMAYYRRAADAGFAAAENAVGSLYDDGLGVPQNRAEAFHWFQKAAEQGYDAAQNNLGVYYQMGYAVPKNLNEAVRWFKLAAENGNPEAANNLTALTLAGRPKRAEPATALWDEGERMYNAGDKEGAFRRFLQAAQAGNSRAQLQVGWHYEFGVGVAQNFAQALAWYRKAAEAGDSTAQRNLGHKYELAIGVPEDWTEAARWYRKSAEQNDPKGMAALARCYEFGIGVPQDRRETIYWDKRAAALGNAESDYYANWLAEPTNNVGFRDEAERDMFPGLITVRVPEPVGILFHSSGERTAWLRKARSEYDYWHAKMMSNIAQTNYQHCKSQGGTNCSPPPPPR